MYALRHQFSHLLSQTFYHLCSTCLTPAASITLTLLTPCEFHPIHLCCSSEETIHMWEMQINTLCQELAQSVQQVHALEMDLKVLKLLGTRCCHSQHHHKCSFSSLNSDSDASGSTSSSWHSHTPSQAILQRKRHCGLPASLKTLEKGKEKMIYHDDEVEKWEVHGVTHGMCKQIVSYSTLWIIELNFIYM